MNAIEGGERCLELWRGEEEIRYVSLRAVAALECRASEKRDGTGVLLLFNGERLGFKLRRAQSIGPLLDLLFGQP